MILGGNRGNGVYAGSRASNRNNYVWNSNSNIGARFACEDIYYALKYAQGLFGATSIWSARLSSVSKIITRFVKVRVAMAKFQDDKRIYRKANRG